MPPLYNVYLAKLSTTPDNWDTANNADYDHSNGWVKFITAMFNDEGVNQNTHTHNAGRVSYRIVTGKVVQRMTLNGLVIVNTGDTENSDYYNAVKEFLLRHMVTGAAASHAYPLYLHIYNASLATKSIKWMNDSEVMVAYCKVNVKGFKFTLTNSGVYIGTIQLEEAWN